MDINGDGFADILSGCYSQHGYDFMVGSFWVLYGDKEGKFAKAVELKGNDGKTLMILNEKDAKNSNFDIKNICTRPYAADLNGDGKLDLVSGNFEGSFYFFAGEGKGAFQSKAVELTDVGGKALKVNSGHSDPFLVDWDADGDLDLLSGGSDGEIVWAENKAAKGEAATMPKFAAFATLIAAPTSGEKGGPEAPSYSVRIHVADINGDGKLDILAGDARHSGGEPRADLSEEEKTKHKALQDEMDKVSEKWQAIYSKYWKEFEEAVEKAGKKLTEEEQEKLWKELVEDKMEKDEELKTTQKRMSELQEELGKYLTPWVSTGNVWVYTQK
ncbi:hypothetical protein EDM80_01250 [bacterium]|nr:MAG: hypothetical protein EDM80_01250 [bacterium]RIK65247.1 MAG: hypothetical protein DCC64_00970 [Planctomycetota bacterium]